MFRLQKILFPVDFSERSLGVGRYVRAVTEHFRAEVTLLHVVEPSAHDQATLDKVALRKTELQQFLQAELRGFRVRRMVREGDPASIIVAAAAGASCDLIMMPTHGWGIYRRFILGSVTAKVLHDATCPVWTCSHAEQAPPRDGMVCRKVLCAVDLGPQSKRIIDYAAGLAASYGAGLLVAHVCQTVELGSAAMRGQDLNGIRLAKAREQIEALVEKAPPRPEIVVEAGDVAGALHRVSLSHPVDLIVIGRSAYDALRGRLRSNSYSIIRQAGCPVISV